MQVTEDTFTLCNTSHVPLHVWGEPSVDNRADIGYLSPGTYYFICSVAGHCSAGMKIKVSFSKNNGSAMIIASGLTIQEIRRCVLYSKVLL